MHHKARLQREEYERLMGSSATARQDRISEELDKCVCAGTGGWHEPDCNRTKAALLRGKR